MDREKFKHYSCNQKKLYPIVLLCALSTIPYEEDSKNNQTKIVDLYQHIKKCLECSRGYEYLRSLFENKGPVPNEYAD